MYTATCVENVPKGLNKCYVRNKVGKGLRQSRQCKFKSSMVGDSSGNGGADGATGD